MVLFLLPPTVMPKKRNAQSGEGGRDLACNGDGWTSTKATRSWDTEAKRTQARL